MSKKSCTFAPMQTAKATLRFLLIFMVILGLQGCSSTKHVPQDELLLNSLKIDIQDNDQISALEMYNYTRQQPNHTVLGFAKLQLGMYNLSGKDTSKWYNRWLRRLGQPPVIYDPSLTDASRRQIRQALINKGYMDAVVVVDTIRNDQKRKMDLVFHINTNTPKVIKSVALQIEDSLINTIVKADSTLIRIAEGDLFDRNKLDAQRLAISERLRNQGYYAFNKEFISFYADTIEGNDSIALTLVVNGPRPTAGTAPVQAQSEAPKKEHAQYHIRNVYVVTDYDGAKQGLDLNFAHQDTILYKGIYILNGPDHYLRPSVINSKCDLRPGELYNAEKVDNTYQGFGQLGILKFVNIDLRPLGEIDGEQYLDAYILLSRGKKQSVTVEVEGTNSEGDLGFGVGVAYQNRNLAHGSELLTAKFRTAYESLSGNWDGLINNRYSEYAAEVSLELPKIQFPFLNHEFKRRKRASTEYSTSINYQERPEYTRIIAGFGWKYKWVRRRSGDIVERHQLDLLDANYVYLPESTIDFIDEIAPTNPLLRYSYEDHFIMRIGYTFSKTNRRIPTATVNSFAIQPSVYSLRFSVETAGNLLYAFSHLLGQRKHEDAYKIFGIQYAQYVKGEFDYSYAMNFNDRNSLAFHGGFGIGYPYGNSSAIPFEKRFYAGGANGVRGWSVRTLGPGSYDSRNSQTDFINQCGDISLLLSMEYRAKLFWVFEAGAFIDAGNIWTIHDYQNQPGGLFRFDTFYKQLAAAYGVGLRMDFTYFLLRFDLGMKAHNPAHNQEHWPLFHPRWHRDATFHFAVGYPF